MVYQHTAFDQRLRVAGGAAREAEFPCSVDVVVAQAAEVGGGGRPALAQLLSTSSLLTALFFVARPSFFPLMSSQL